MERWASDYIGIPFVSGGRTREGCDCYGLLRLVEKEVFDIELPDISGYSNACDSKETDALFKENCPLLLGKKVESPKAGNIVLMFNRGLPTHIGIFVGGGYILHTSANVGSCLQRTTDKGISSHIEGYYELEGTGGDPSASDRHIQRLRDRA